MENEEKIKYSKEYWNVKNAGKRLLYKLSPMKNGKYRTIEVDESDFNALKSILGYINRVDSKTIYNNELFAKLYIMELVGQIRESETTVFNDFLFKNISNQLNRLTENNFDTKEADEIIKDRIRFEETFSLDYVKTKLDEMMNATLHRRS